MAWLLSLFLSVNEPIISYTNFSLPSPRPHLRIRRNLLCLRPTSTSSTGAFCNLFPSKKERVFKTFLFLYWAALACKGSLFHSEESWPIPYQKPTYRYSVKCYFINRLFRYILWRNPASLISSLVPVCDSVLSYNDVTLAYLISFKPEQTTEREGFQCRRLKYVRKTLIHI